MPLGDLEPLAAMAVEDVQVDRTGTGRDLDDPRGCGMYPRCGGLVDLDNPGVTPLRHYDQPARTIEHVPAAGPVVVPAADHHVPRAVVIMGARGRTNVPRLYLDHSHMAGRLVVGIVKRESAIRTAHSYKGQTRS